MQKLFGHAPQAYYSALALLLRSEFFRGWIADEQEMGNRLIGRVCGVAAVFGGGTIRRLSRLWWRFARKVVARRSAEIVRGGAARRLLECKPELRIEHFVSGHQHEASITSVRVAKGAGDYCTTVSPRWHVTGLTDGGRRVELYRDSAVVVLEGNGRFRYDSERERDSWEASRLIERRMDCGGKRGSND